MLRGGLADGFPAIIDELVIHWLADERLGDSAGAGHSAGYQVSLLRCERTYSAPTWPLGNH
jgi:hypothetical protein